MFATPAIALWDALRLVSAVLALGAIAMIPGSIAKPKMLWHQKARMAGEGGMCVAVIGAYLYQLGTYPEQWWRNLLVLAAVGLIFAGHVGFHGLYGYGDRRRR